MIEQADMLAIRRFDRSEVFAFAAHDDDAPASRPSFQTNSRIYGNRSRTDANDAVGRQLVDERSQHHRMGPLPGSKVAAPRSHIDLQKKDICRLDYSSRPARS